MPPPDPRASAKNAFPSGNDRHPAATTFGCQTDPVDHGARCGTSLAGARHMGNRKVRDLMSTNVETLSQHETVDLATTIITLGRIRHLPVTDAQNRVRGLVTHRDVLECLAALYRDDGPNADASKLEVGRMMTRDVATIEPDMPLAEAATLMFERKFGCLPVVENEELVGIITEADFVADAMNG